MVNDKKNNGRDGQEEKPGKPFIVAIGASAGGVQALQAFIRWLPAPTGAAYVVVVSLDPQRRSEPPQIPAARSRMPGTQAAGKQQPAADHLYGVPPGRRP